MLRSVFHVGLLRRLSLLKQITAPPGVADVTKVTINAATWQRNFAVHTTSEETTSEYDKKASPDRHDRGDTIKKFPAKRVPRGKQLHSRVLTENQMAEREQMRHWMRNQSAEDTFGQFPQKHTHEQSKKSKQRKAGNANGLRQRTISIATSPVLTKQEQQLQLAASGGVTRPEEGVDGKVLLTQWNDIFGTMAEPDDLKPPPQGKSGEPDSHSRAEGKTKYEEDDDEDDFHVSLREYGRNSRKNVFWYGRQLEKLGKQGQVYEAIQLLEDTMIKEDRVQPNAYVFTVLIGILGRVGYTKKAFNLFNKMKKYGLKPEDPTYTALFNACANSPWREDGLTRASRLVQQMIEKDIEPNNSTLKAAVKAYGKLGELQTAFRMVDRMLGAGHSMDPGTWKHLLIACVSDSDAGLNHAVKVWRLMRKKKMTPDLDHYNLLLRVARDCRVGDSQFANTLVGGANSLPPGRDTEATNSQAPDGAREPHQQQEVPPGERHDVGEVRHKPWFEYDAVPVSGKSILPSVDADDSAATQLDTSSESTTDVQQHDHAISILDANVPNILNPRGIWRHGIKLGSLDTPEARLALLGGLPGVLSHMARDGVKPDIKTFSQLLDMCPKEESAEDDLVAVMITHDVKPDADLLNQIIRRRCNRRDVEAAKEVLGLFNRMRLVPNLLTYGSLALGCREHSSGLQLLQDMENAGIDVTPDIFGILLRRSRWDFRYKKTLCQRMRRLNVTPTPAIVENLETSVAFARKVIVQKEKGEQVPHHFNRPKFTEEFSEFLVYYKGWLLKSPLEQPQHPWSQFRQPTGGDRSPVPTDHQTEPVR